MSVVNRMQSNGYTTIGACQSQNYVMITFCRAPHTGEAPTGRVPEVRQGGTDAPDARRYSRHSPGTGQHHQGSQDRRLQEPHGSRGLA